MFFEIRLLLLSPQFKLNLLLPCLPLFPRRCPFKQPGITHCSSVLFLYAAMISSIFPVIQGITFMPMLSMARNIHPLIAIAENDHKPISAQYFIHFITKTPHSSAINPFFESVHFLRGAPINPRTFAPSPEYL